MDDENRNERPTLVPPFDPAKFARDSETRHREVGSSEPAPSTARRPVPPSTQRPALSAPAWGRMAGGRPSAPDVVELSTTNENAREFLGTDAVPELVMSKDELEWFALSSEASRLIEHIDAKSPIDVVCAKANVATPEGAIILLELAEQGIVTFR